MPTQVTRQTILRLALATVAGAGTIVGEARADGRMPPTVIVYPDGVGPRGGTEDHWADRYVPGDNMESDLVDDLIPSVQAHFRVVPGAHTWDAWRRLLLTAPDAMGELVGEPAAT
jgi:enterochelin esterase-like enzyme